MNQLNSRPNGKRITNLLIGIIVIIVIVFIIWKNIHPDIGNTFTLDLGSDKDTDREKFFYLNNEYPLSPRVIYGDLNYREAIKDSPFNFTFNKPESPNNSYNATLEITLLGIESNLYLNDKLVIPSIRDYRLFREFEDSYLYIRKNLTSREDYENKDVLDFITSNYYGSNIYSFNLLDKIRPTISNYTNKNTLIGSKFRDNLNLIIYKENDLYLSFKKQDINAYYGEDAYLVTLRSINGSIIFEKILEDDRSIRNDSVIGYEQNYTLTIPDLNGVYYLSFHRKDGNKYADSLISNISLNTNKVLIAGNFLVTNPINIYMENQFDRNISFYYWHRDGQQIIDIDNNGIVDKVNLTEGYKGVRYNYVLNPGEHNIFINKSYVWVFNNFNFAISKENWFEIPIIMQDQLNDPDFIILDRSKIKLNKGSFTFRTPIEINGSKLDFSLRASDKGKIKIDKIRLILQ